MPKPHEAYLDTWAAFVLALLACLPAASFWAEITYEMATVGDSGNANDTTGYGGKMRFSANVSLQWIIAIPMHTGCS